MLGSNTFLQCCRFQALRDLMPTQEKMDKASFLLASVDYIRRLQVRLWPEATCSWHQHMHVLKPVKLPHRAPGSLWEAKVTAPLLQNDPLHT